MKHKKKETIFLSGTDRVEDVMNSLYRDLRSMGYSPLWFRKPDFPELHHDAMQNCIEVAKIADRLILVIDERAGLPYQQLGTTITEAEFLTARRLDKKCLVFVRAKIWHMSKIFHRFNKEKEITDEDAFNKIKLDGDLETYRFIERLQHAKRDDQSFVPWIVPFDLADDIVELIRSKWLLSNEQQIAGILALNDKMSEKDESLEHKIQRAGFNIENIPNATIAVAAINQINSLTLPEQKKVQASLRALSKELFDGGKNPTRIYKLSGEQNISILRIDDLLRIKLRSLDDGNVDILSIVKRK